MGLKTLCSIVLMTAVSTITATVNAEEQAAPDKAVLRELEILIVKAEEAATAAAEKEAAIINAAEIIIREAKRSARGAKLAANETREAMAAGDPSRAKLAAKTAASFEQYADKVYAGIATTAADAELRSAHAAVRAPLAHEFFSFLQP